MNNLKKIIEELITIRKDNKLKFNDNTLIDVAVRIFNSQNIQENKPKFEPVTEKQRALLIRMGYPDNIDKLSKNEAKHLIYEQIKKQRGEDEINN